MIFKRKDDFGLLPDFLKSCWRWLLEKDADNDERITFYCDACEHDRCTREEAQKCAVQDFLERNELVCNDLTE